jgi:hypothetical protein
LRQPRQILGPKLHFDGIDVGLIDRSGVTTANDPSGQRTSGGD